MDFLHKAETALRLSTDAINSIPAHSWYVAGVLIGLGIATSSLIAFINYRHQWKTAEKYAKHVTGYLLNLITAALVPVAYFVTNSQDFLPFLGAAYPSIYAAATAFYQFGGSKLYQWAATHIGAWANDRKQPKQSIFTTKLENPSKEVEEQPASTSLFN